MENQNLPKGMKQFGLVFSLMYVIVSGLQVLDLQEKNQNSAVQEVEEKIRQNQTLLQETDSQTDSREQRRLVMKQKANTGGK